MLLLQERQRREKRKMKVRIIFVEILLNRYFLLYIKVKYVIERRSSSLNVDSSHSRRFLHTIRFIISSSAMGPWIWSGFAEFLSKF